jgi:periplasmic divalent cation tolerance protein
MEDESLVVFITAPSEEIAEKIADLLVKQKLAACVNLWSPIYSVYSWEGKVCKDEEVLMLVKTRASLFEDRLIPAVKSIHPYQLPEIIGLPIRMGLPGYLEWILQSTQPVSDHS